MDGDDDTYILLLLADSNLPTGSFVASSGLESYMKHGFGSGDVVTFVRDSLASYGRSALPFVSDAHRLMSRYRDGDSNDSAVVIEELAALEELYDSMTLNHVARRASKAQGVALLTLYTKAFAPPASHPENSRHLPTCWGVLTAALGLTLERACYLHLFLHARGLLSASVRLNDIGPYNSQQILLHTVRPLVAVEAELCCGLSTGTIVQDEAFDPVAHGPANTWPLGEILAARHDLQHSRIFNS
ncbi:urease accessory protein UreF [Hymenopellis radicata]|nr:urease accessory protein UreF [Hymenopellis radicata]